ncbi:MAG: UDP-N-acetylmuramate--L-alanine ligase [Phycisphaeraceae bacterium]
MTMVMHEPTCPQGATSLTPRRLSNQPLELAGKRVHFVGIGGSGMSGLARIAQHAGAACTGSDLDNSTLIESLQHDGFAVTLRQTTESVPAQCDLLVISAAIKADHPEVLEARRRGIEVIKYAQMLGRLMIGRTGVAVAGTHGKSSTTSMLSHVLIQAGLDPSVIVGATCKQIGGGARSSSIAPGSPGSPGHPGSPGGILVAEACEYDRSFHNFNPTHAVILNVEADHLDIYKSLEEVVESFAVFARKLNDLPPQAGATLLINHEMPHRLTITAGLNCQVQTIGFAPQADWRVEVSGAACPSVKLLYHSQVRAEWKSPMPGEHMAYNAAAAAVLASQLGTPWDAIVRGIESFAGLDRRMQHLGQRDVGGQRITVVDDYGHHPTEVDTTLRALRRHYEPKRLICVFQPHQHSRTRFLMNEFASSFSEADIVIVPDIYFVRDSEQERQAVTAADLVDRLRQRGKAAMHLYPFEAIVEQLEVITRDGDLVVTMGAGDVWKIGTAFLKS